MKPTMETVIDMIARCCASYNEPGPSADLIAMNNTQAMCWDLGDVLVVAFRGSQLREARSGKWFADWRTNLKCRLVNDGDEGKFHRGYLGDYGQIEEKLLAWVQATPRASKKIIITGHSAGGALALQLAKAVAARVRYVITFGAPRCSNMRWNLNYPLNHKTFRIVLDNDLVPRLPPIIIGARHLGNLWFVTGARELHQNPPYGVVLRAFLCHRPFGPLIDHTAQRYYPAMLECNRKLKHA